MSPSPNLYTKLVSRVLFSLHERVLSYKIVQEQLTHVRVMAIPEPEFPPTAPETIRRRYRGLLGAEVNVLVERVAEIPREASGKFRHVVTRVALPRSTAVTTVPSRG